MMICELFGRHHGLIVALAGLALADCSAPSSSVSTPDLILHSGKILTVNASFDTAEALAIENDKIVAVGSNAEVLALKADDTKLMGLGGRTVIPGLMDTHAHPTDDGMHLFRLDLSKVESVAEIVELVEAEVQKKAPGEWITNSRYWNEKRLAEQRNPTRFDLDPVSLENPVYLGRGHLGVINTAAMKKLGINRTTADPPGGAFERDEHTGELTGRLYETAAERVKEALPAPRPEELMAAQQQSFRELLAAGVTSVRAAAETPESMRALIELRRRGELPLRISVAIRLNPNLPEAELERILRETPAASGLGDEMLSLWGIKLIADGGSDLAYLREDYRSRPGFRGQLGGSPETFARTIQLCNRYGWRVATHALGDAAIDLVLDAYEAADRESSIADKRWSIEHGYFLQPEHFDRVRRLGLVLHPQTRHLYYLRRSFLENYGSDYADMTHPYRSLLDHEIPIAGGADWPVQPHDFFFYMWVDVTRQTAEGEPVGLGQRLTRKEALRLYTSWAAYSDFDEHRKGSLEPGKLGDLVVLSADYLSVPEEEMKTITPILTMVGGEVVFGEIEDFQP